MSLLCDFEFPLKNQLLSASIGSSVASLIAVVVSVSNDVNIGNNRSFVILSLSEEYVISLLVSSLLFLLHNLKTCFWILLGFLEPDSKSLCCCKFVLFSSLILSLYS